MIKHIPIPPSFSLTSPVSPIEKPSRIERIEPAWITRAIRNRNNEARVLLYDHGKPQEGDTLKILATRLLKNIEDLRRIEKEIRPLFFVCHSTGGLVLKMALAEAQRSRSRNPILGDCYGVTFFSTPHRGSSYLSRPEFSYSVAELMKWSAPLPDSISESLQLDNDLLRKLDSDFKGLATEFQVWTLFETEDTELSNEFHAPITSIKSALLNLRHEVVYPLLSDHANCASFGNNNKQIKESYLGELSDAIKKALELSTTKHTEMNLDDRVKVEINGFYKISTDEASMKVWSTTRSLRDFKRLGPTKLLEDRLSEINAPPKERQYLRQNTRASNFQSGKRKDPGPAAPAFKAATAFAPSNISSAIGTKTKKLLAGKGKEKGSEDTKAQQNLQSTVTSKDVDIPSVAITPGESRFSPDTPSIRSIEVQSTPRPSSASPPVGGPASDSPERRPRQMNRGELYPDAPENRLRTRSTRPDKSPSGRQVNGDTPVTMAIPTAFSRPDMSKQKLVWIHIPFNNPIWVKVGNLASHTRQV